MKALVRFLLGAWLLVVLQSTIIEFWLPTWLPKPLLVVPIVVTMGFVAPTAATAVAAACLGFLCDVFLGGVWGAWMLVATVTYLLVAIAARQMFVQSAGVIAGMSTVGVFSALSVMGAFSSRTDGWGSFLLEVLMRAASTGALSLFLFPLILRVVEGRKKLV